MDASHSGPVPEPPTRHGLHVRENPGSLPVWRFRDEGVTVTASGLEWTADGIDRKQPFAGIASIRLETGHVPRSGMFGNCIVSFRSGLILVVNSLDSWGTPDDDRIATYCAFVDDLHARLGPADRTRIRFLAGNSHGRYRFLVLAAVLGAAMFVVLPLGLLAWTGESEALFLTLAGAFLVYPMLLLVRKNAPRSYDPDRLDDDLFP